MEVPVWAETLFEKIVVIFETPTVGTPLEEVGSMDLLPWIDSLLVELPELIASFKANIFPTSFLTNVLGLSAEAVAKLPRTLIAFLLLYLLCGGATLALRLRQEQTSLSSFTRQVFNVILTWCCFLFIPMLKLLTKNGGFGGSFYPYLALGVVVLSVALPLVSAIHYLWVYRLKGIPHLVFDVGFGPFVLAVLLLSAHWGVRALYILILLAMAGLTVVQWDRHHDEEDGPGGYHKTAQPAPEAKVPQKAAPEPEVQISPEVDIDAILAEKDSLSQP